MYSVHCTLPTYYLKYTGFFPNYYLTYTILINILYNIIYSVNMKLTLGSYYA